MDRIYIIGSCDCTESSNLKFKTRAAALKEMGYMVESPVEIRKKVKRVISYKEPTAFDYMRANLETLMKCTGISLLDNWKSSWSARIEHIIAKSCGMKIVDVKLFNPRWGKD